MEAGDYCVFVTERDSETSVYFHFKKRHSISRKNVPERIEDFADALEARTASLFSLISQGTKEKHVYDQS